VVAQAITVAVLPAQAGVLRPIVRLVRTTVHRQVPVRQALIPVVDSVVAILVVEALLAIGDIMKRYLALLLTLVVSLFATSSFAFTPPPAPTNGFYVSDQAGKMSTEQIAQLNQKIERISKATKNEFGVLLLQDMDGADISDVANATFKAWGVGKHGLDNGCLIVVSIKERKSRIETGKGVEGEVTDLQAKDILDNTLRPHLRKGDFAGGFSDTLDALSSLMESRQNKTATPVTPGSNASNATSSTSTSNSSGCDVAAAGSDGSGMLTGLLILAGCVTVLLLVRRASKRREEAYNQAMLAAENQLIADRQEAERNRQRDERLRVAKEAREAAARNANPFAATPAPVVHAQASNPPPKPVREPVVSHNVKVAAVVGAVGTAAALAALEEERQAKAAKHRREQEEEDRRRRQREDDEASARRRRDEESSSSSSSIFSSSSSSDSGFGGGFGGGDSGGGGASSDW
jgi:uncharacterized membrane protein YgcG